MSSRFSKISGAARRVGCLIAVLAFVSGCASGSSGSSPGSGSSSSSSGTTSKNNAQLLTEYTKQAFSNAQAGNWEETHKYLNLLKQDGWNPTKLYTFGKDILDKGLANNRSGSSTTLNKDERRLGLIFIYFSALGDYPLAQVELGILYSEQNYYLGKPNILKAYYWFEKALSNPGSNFKAKTMDDLRVINTRYKNEMTPNQLQLVNRSLQTPRFIMPL